MNIAGSAIDYATYLGGPESTRAWAWQWIGSFQHMSPARPRRWTPDHQSADQSNTGNQIPLSGSEGAFITKFTEDGSALIFSASWEARKPIRATPSPSPGLDHPELSDIYVAGDTTSPDLLKTLLLQAPTVSDPSPYIPPQPANAETATRL